MTDSLDIFLKVKKRDISFICACLESFEGLFAVRTLEPKPSQPASILHVMVSPDFKDAFGAVIKELTEKFEIETISA